MATVEALQAMDDRSRSPTPDYEEFQDIPEVPEVFDDIPMFSPEKSPEPAATEGAAECAKSIEILRNSCGPISLQAKEVCDENFNVNREELDFNDPDGPECMHSRVGVKALRDKLNKMACDSPRCDGTPSKVTKTKETTRVTTREVRTHEKPTALRMSILATQDDQPQDTVAANEFPSPPKRQLFEELDAQETAHASVDAMPVLQMSSEDCENRSFGMGEGCGATPDQGNPEVSDLQEAGLQICDSPEPHATNGSEDGESNAFSQHQDGSFDATPAQTLSRVVKVFSENDHDSQALTPNDHARATIAAMKAKCTARMPAPPPKVQASEEHNEVEYSNEEIEALADALLNPTKKKVAETPRTTTPSKINNHLREALKEIHYSPSARASAMLQKLRQKELFCRKVPAPKAPKGSILGLQPGRSLMPVDGLAAANMAALATVNASMSPHLKNNIQHSRRSKMPDKGHEAADRAAFSEVKSIRTRKLALFTQPELSTEEQEMQKKKWAEYVSKYGDMAKSRFEESCNNEQIPAPIFVQVDDSVDTNYGPVVIEGLQESIDGLQDSFSSEEGGGDYTMQASKDDESIDALQQDDLSDDEICPEFAHRIQIDYAVQEKVDKIRMTQVFFVVRPFCLVLAVHCTFSSASCHPCPFRSLDIPRYVGLPCSVADFVLMANVTQAQVQEIGRKVLVLGQRVGQDRSESHEPATQLMGDACPMPQMEEMSKAQKILDLFDVISQTVCESEEHRVENVEDNKLMPEIISLRAAQLALIQDDYDYAIDTVAEVKDTFTLEGYTRCNGLLDQLTKLISTEKSSFDARKANWELASQIHTKEEVQRFHAKRGAQILQYARTALAHSRFDHALAFIVKSKRAYTESDQPEMLKELEELNRSVVMEATRMASDSIILEATRISSTSSQAYGNSSLKGTHSQQLSARSAASDGTESMASDAPTEASHPAQVSFVHNEDEASHPAQIPVVREEDDLETLFVPSDATSKLIARIQDGGRVALNQDHDEIEEDIQRLRAGLETSKAHLKDELAPLHRMTGATPTRVASVSSVSMSPHAKKAQQQQQSCETGNPHAMSIDQMSVQTLLGNGYAPVDKELEKGVFVPARKESRQALQTFPDSDPALLKATSSYRGGMVGSAMVSSFLSRMLASCMHNAAPEAMLVFALLAIRLRIPPLPSHQTSDKFYVFCVHSGSTLRQGQPGLGNLNLLPGRQHDADLHQLTAYFTDESAEERTQIHTVHKTELQYGTHAHLYFHRHKNKTHLLTARKRGRGVGRAQREANHLMIPSA
jgi:hypothetical protein